MKTIGLLYSFNTKKSTQIAQKIKKAFGKDVEIEEVNVEEITKEKFNSFNNLILSVPTWFDGELPNYWDEFLPDMEELNLKGKKIAIFGLGDQVGYPQNFVDGIGIMTNILEELGATVVGLTSTEGYTFESSKAMRENEFTGLVLDYENQARLNNKRVTDWVEMLKKQFN